MIAEVLEKGDWEMLIQKQCGYKAHPGNAAEPLAKRAARRSVAGIFQCS
jgi:hypothetical protein